MNVPLSLHIFPQSKSEHGIADSPAVLSGDIWAGTLPPLRLSVPVCSVFPNPPFSPSLSPWVRVCLSLTFSLSVSPHSSLTLARWINTTRARIFAFAPLFFSLSIFAVFTFKCAIFS